LETKLPRIPQYLSAPLQVLWFEPDDLAVCIISFTIASIFKGFFWFLILAGPFVYMRYKLKYPKSFLKHMLYFIGIKNLKHYPSIFYKNFNE